MADTSELLRLCEDVIYATKSGEYTAMTNGEATKVCEDAAPLLARALKSRLQAEAPEDAEVAEIEKRVERNATRMRDLSPSLMPKWAYIAAGESYDDCRTLLAKLRATSQAEAQAPTTAAQASVLTEYEAERVRRSKERWNPESEVGELYTIIDRLVGAPAPAPTREQIEETLKQARAAWFESDSFDSRKRTEYEVNAILDLIAKGDTP